MQRSQVDEVFKSLKGGDELEEATPRAFILRTFCSIRSCSLESLLATEVATKLYPHQLKAVTFLLAREQELEGSSARRQTSLWQERVNPLSHQISWINVVTQTEEFAKPFEAKGAILADDVRSVSPVLWVS